jgi:hypothetical protein
MQRVLTLLGDTPVAVFTADWRLAWWNRSWAALLGDPTAIVPEDRSLIMSRSPADRPAGSRTGRSYRRTGRRPTARSSPTCAAPRPAIPLTPDWPR